MLNNQKHLKGWVKIPISKHMKESHYGVYDVKNNFVLQNNRVFEKKLTKIDVNLL